MSMESRPITGQKILNSTHSQNIAENIGKNGKEKEIHQSKFVLSIDSREKMPLEFKPGVFDEIITEGLPFADYWISINDKQFPLCFERKGFGDLYGTMTSGYARFKRELELAKENKFSIILLIEGTMREVAGGYHHSKFTGDSMLKKLAMLYVRYGLEYHFFQDRREMARYIEEIFSAVKRNFKQE